MTKNQKIWIAIAIFVVIFIGWRVYEGRQQGDTIKIGALLSLSGNGAAWGQNAQKAIALATEEINSRGGIHGKQIQMIYEDTAGDAKQAVSAYQELVSVDHATAILGPLTQTETASIVPLINQDNIPVLAPAFAPLQNRINLKNPLMVWMDPSTEAARMAQYVFDQGMRKVGVVGTLDSWENTVSTAFAQKFQALGGTITKEEIVQPDVADVKLPITEIVATRPQAIFLGTYYQFVHATKSLHDLGYQGKQYSIEVDDYLAGQVYGWTQGLQFIAPDFYINDFVTAFKDKYGVAPGMPAGQSFDATNILFSFLSQSENRNDILRMMENFHQYNGVSGELQITSDGRTLLPMALFKIEASGTIQRIFGLN
jgi:branched-chain amino acid transport system substrate-binding protein